MWLACGRWHGMMREYKASGMGKGWLEIRNTKPETKYQSIRKTKISEIKTPTKERERREFGRNCRGKRRGSWDSSGV